MHFPDFLGSRRNLAVASAALAILGTAAGWHFATPGSPRYEKRGYLHCVEVGGDRYSFDPVWRVESYRRVDPRTGLDAGTKNDASRAERLRSALLRTLGVERLEQIPVEGAAEVEAIRALGYI